MLKGKYERYLRSVRQRFLPNLNPSDTDSLDTLNRRLAAWVEGEYHHSAHRGLAGVTPADKWAECALYVRLVDDSVGLDDLFLEVPTAFKCRRNSVQVSSEIAVPHLLRSTVVC